VNNPLVFLLNATLLGIGATFTFDLWGMFLKFAFNVAPSNICLVGRWLQYMPQRIFTHSNIVFTPKKDGECAVGWIAHYTIGIIFAGTFVLVAGSDWLQHPTPIPALPFGVVSVLFPFFIMQPAFGFGLAGSNVSNPVQARLRSLTNHTAFGIGLYFFGLLGSRLLLEFTKN